MIICVDFDGTCVSHEFPEVGKDIGAVPVLKKLVEQGHQLILWTMRANSTASLIVNSDDKNIHPHGGEYLTQAIEWFHNNNITLWGIQNNPNQHTWTSSPKAYAQLYIDDAALGCPLAHNKDISKRPFVDWVEVEQALLMAGILQ